MAKPFRMEEFHLDEELAKIRRSVKKPNILIAGATGSGKSSVINHVFGRDLTRVAAGEPVTRGIHRFEDERVGVVLFDSEGYEIGSDRQAHYEEEILGCIDAKQRLSPPERIHFVWYVVNASTKRVTPLDLELIERMKSQASVAVLLTQIDQVDAEELAALRSVVETVIDAERVFPLTISTDILENPELAHFAEWSRLLSWSVQTLDESLQEGLLMEIRTRDAAVLALKRKKANKIISGYVTAAGAAAAVPLPFSDAMALTPIQVTMSVHLFKYWGVKADDNMLRTLIGSTIVPQVGRMLSKTLLVNIGKFFPGVNTAASVINATVASGITWAIGQALNEIAYRNALDSTKTIEQMLNNEFVALFERFLRKRTPSSKA